MTTASDVKKTTPATPTYLIYHARKRYGADVDLETLTDAQRAAAEADRIKWLSNFTTKGTRASRRSRYFAKAAKLRAQADELEQLAAAL